MRLSSRRKQATSKPYAFSRTGNSVDLKLTPHE